MQAVLTLALLLAISSCQTGSVSSLSRKHRTSDISLDEETNKVDDGWPATFLEEPRDYDSRDPCAYHFCERGRQCTVSPSTKEPHCTCRATCPLHRKLVCGTDGKLYLNHCELHKTACILKSSIRIDHTRKCLKSGVHPVVWDQSISDTVTQRAPSAPVTSTAVPHSQHVMTVVHTPPPSLVVTEVRQVVKKCDIKSYRTLKDKLLRSLSSKKSEAETQEYMLRKIFNKYDEDHNKSLDVEELKRASQTEVIQVSGCSIKDTLRYDDADSNGLISLSEFYATFSLAIVSLDKALAVRDVSARVGDNLEIKCEVTGTPTPHIVWRRNGLDLAALNSEEIRVFVDGSLYLTKLQLIHSGNYTCQADKNPDVVQTHMLQVHTTPRVRVTPHIQDLKPGETATMNCKATGEPFPKVQWLKNDEPLRLDIPLKYEVVGNGTQLSVRSVGFADTGAYMCQASSVGGVSTDISSLVVQEAPMHRDANKLSKFVVFHDSGLSVYEPNDCHVIHVIQGTDVIPGTQEYVCGNKGTVCSWGRSALVADRYIYVSQPEKDRVLVISVEQMVVVDVIATDQYPVQLWYVEYLDQVWVLNWRSTFDEGIKTIQVIRFASHKKKHHTVHPEPIDGHFDLVMNLFVPPTQDLGHEFRHAYVTHSHQRGFYKLDLANMKYVKTVDLTPYNCVPISLVYSSLHGLVVVDCSEPMTGRRTGQIVLDYLTDSVISVMSSLVGQPFISPDSQLVVTVSNANRNNIVVQKVTDHGLQYLYDVSTSVNISDVTFFPSRVSHTYDLYAASADQDYILSLDLHNGKIELITGVGYSLASAKVSWGNSRRSVRSEGQFAQYLVSPFEEGAFVVNGVSRTINCEIGSLKHPQFSLWVRQGEI